MLFISFLYIIFFPFPSTHLTFFSSTVLLSSHHFLFYALLVSLPCLPHFLLPLIFFLPLTTHFFSCLTHLTLPLHLMHLFLSSSHASLSFHFLSLNDFLPVAFTFPSFTPLPYLLSCHVSLPFLLLPFLLSCLTSFALFLSHLTSFPLNSTPLPPIIIFQHTRSPIKRLIQMMCGLSDMLLWCEREEEREREGACVVCN